MSSLKESLLHTFRGQAEMQGKAHKVYVVAEELGLLDADDETYYASDNIYGDTLSIRLAFYSSLSGTAADNMGVVAKKLLPQLGELRKEFDEAENRLRLTADYKGVQIILDSAPPSTCTVEKVEEEVEVPEKVIPAHTEKKVRWVMKGDCDPLMSPAPASTPAESRAEVEL